jgi:phthalate 4,5-dioxygenase oxygenase subunit
MLKRDDNERLVRVGPGTPAGELFRRYWQPVLLSSELPARDGAPLRLRILSEDLLAFRDSENRVGLVDAFCPHRRAPLFYGRNEECGLRCIYHGWKFDVHGDCVDMPSEPADTPMKEKVKLPAYPTVERAGVIWAYMGPRDQAPPPPDYEWMRAPATHRHVSKTIERCNYLQALEGGLDTAHSSFLHNNHMDDPTQLRSRDRAPRIDIEVTDYGYYYVSTRNAGPDSHYIRVYHYIMPAQQMRANVVAREGGRAKVPKFDGHIWLPIDDEHTLVYNWTYGYDESARFSPEFIENWEATYGRGTQDMVPGAFTLRRNLDNDYLIDRQLQKSRTFSGIQGINTQDFALQEGMGPIVDRSKENLGLSDKAIVTMRRLMIDATRQVERGERPKGAEPATHRSVRPYEQVLPKDQDWRQAFAAELVAKW